LGENVLLGSGIYTLLVFEGKLYAGGYFSIGPANPTFGRENMAVWDGSQWTWVQGYANDTVFVLKNIGGHVTAGGAFTNVGGSQASKTAWFDGARWNRFSNNIDGTVRAMAEYNGSIYAAGDFESIEISGGGIYAGSLARWTGTEWTRLSSYLTCVGPSYPRIWDLTVFDNKLFAAGSFPDGMGSGISIHNIGAWDGTSWSAYGSNLNTARRVYDYEGALVAGGSSGIFGWTGSTWTPVVNIGTGSVNSICYYQYQYYAGGSFRVMESDTVNYVAVWTPHSAGGLRTGFNSPVYDITWWTGNLTVCGSFTRTCDCRAFRVAKHDGAQWRFVGDLIPPGFNTSFPRSLVIRNDTLYGAGAFGYDSYTPVFPMMKFNGTRWDFYGPAGGTYPGFLSIPVFDAATYGDQIVLGGTQLMPLNFLYYVGPSGVGYFAGPPNGPVNAVLAHDGVLLAGGAFTTMAGNPARRVASWNGSEWTALGSGTNGTVYALEVYGDLVVVGGTFDSAGGVAARNIAAWDGVSWHALGAGVDGKVTALAVYDNKLIAGGEFHSAGGVAADYIAEWYAASWSPLGSGLGGPVITLYAHDSSLFVGGDFLTAGGHSSAYLARWDHFLGTPTDVDRDPHAPSLPGSFDLSQNYPNPFNPDTRISFSLPRNGQVTLEIFNILGQRVRELVNEVRPAGTYAVEWDGTDDFGKRVSSGVYFYRLNSGTEVLAKKMMLLK
jgi:hypothetical protein